MADDLRYSSTWTVDTLKTYIDALLHERDSKYEDRVIATEKEFREMITGLRELIQANLAASKEAVSKAEASNEKRFDAVNEFRSQLGDILSNAMPRVEAEQRLKAAIDKGDIADKGIESRIDGVIGRVNGLDTRINRNEGRGMGLNAGWGYFLGAVGLIVGIIEAIFYLTHH